MVLRFLLVFVLFSICQFSMAQTRELGSDQYFKNNFSNLVQPLPIPARWVDDSHVLLLKGGKASLLDAKTGVITEPTDAQKNITKQPSKVEIVLKNGNIFSKIDGVETQLTNDKAPAVNPTLSPDGNYVAFTRLNDLYTVNVNTKQLHRLSTDGTDQILNGYASWVYMEEILGRSTTYKAYWWSPDSKHVAYFRSDQTSIPEFVITDAPGLHGTIEKTKYPKVGDPNPTVKVGIVPTEGGATVWTDINDATDQYFGMPYWRPDGSSVLVQWMNRLQDSLIVYDVNIKTGAKTPFYVENQKTWINLDDKDKLQFINKGENVIVSNDASGWQHLYLHNKNGVLINAITEGKFTVTDINYVDEKNKVIYFTAKGKENTAHTDLYSVGLNGKNLKRLTFGNFNHFVVSVSPKADYFLTVYSNVSTPSQLALVNNKGKITPIADSKLATYADYNLAKTEFLRVKSDDGLYDLPMKVTWPLAMEAGKKYPVLVSIYGGPNAGTSSDTWSLTGAQQWYAKEGIIQVVMDHRASGHFGKEGVNFMYHNLGYWEMKDYSTMVKWLIANKQADAEKIAITGFSYGGYLSSYAVTYGADVFKYAMAGGSVTDWMLYDSHYTERYMGTPANNPEGYKTSSVLNYVDKYKGMLQLVHGNIDDNVHLQNSIQLASKLQDAKKDFEYMTYSGGRHGWGGNKRAHFENLKTKFIYKYLLEKDVPEGLLR